VELYLYSPNTPSWYGAQLKHRDNFTFTLRKIIFKAKIYSAFQRSRNIPSEF
jgi:hypothetical protein